MPTLDDVRGEAVGGSERVADDPTARRGVPDHRDREWLAPDEGAGMRRRTKFGRFRDLVDAR